MICLLKPLHFQCDRQKHGFTRCKNPHRGSYNLTVTTETFYVNTCVGEQGYSTTWTSMFDTSFTEMINDFIKEH